MRFYICFLSYIASSKNFFFPYGIVAMISNLAIDSDVLLLLTYRVLFSLFKLTDILQTLISSAVLEYDDQYQILVSNSYPILGFTQRYRGIYGNIIMRSVQLH